MARYDYLCRSCGDQFELTRPMNESDTPATCACGEPHAQRVWSPIAVTGAGAPAGGGGGGGGCCGGGCCGGG